MQKLVITFSFLLFTLSVIQAQENRNEYIDKFKKEKKVTDLILSIKGIPTFIKGNLTPKDVKLNETEEEKTYRFFEENEILFNMSEPRKQLKIMKVVKDELGMTHVKLRQIYQNIEVYGTELIAHFTSMGELSIINGEYYTGIDGPTKPIISINDAEKIAKSDIFFQGKEPTVLNYKMVIFQFQDQVYLTWNIVISVEEPVGRWEYFISTVNGEVVYKADRFKYELTSDYSAILKNVFSEIVTNPLVSIIDADAIGTGTGVMGDTKNHIDTYGLPGSYDLLDRTRRLNNNIHNHNGKMLSDQSIETRMYPSSVPMNDADNVWNNSAQSPGIDAHVYAGLTYDWMLSQFSRNSYDNAGKGMLSVVENSTDNNNAGWDGSKVTYYTVTSGHRSMAGAIDIVAHEWGHAITDYESNLIYEKEPGALNESFSDMTGIAVGFATGIDPDWQQGENYNTNETPIRDLSNPHVRNQPDTYLTDQYWISVVSCTPSKSNDYCGVHTNSGVPNKMFYLLSQGGTFNGVTVTGIGISNAVKIMYRANANYWTSSTVFINAKLGSISAANDLDATGNWATQTKNAWEAVKVGVLACSLTVTPESQSVANTAGTASFSILFPGCTDQAWSATDNAAWLTLSPAS
jgi:bacillolysin